MHHVSCIIHCRLEAEIWYVDCSHKYEINQVVMVGGRRPLVEDDLWWKTTFRGKRPLGLTTFGIRQPFIEDNLRWKMTFGGRRPSVEDKLCWKMTFGERRPFVERQLLSKVGG